MNGIIDLIGNGIIFIGLIFMVFGAIGVFRFKNFYARLLATSKVDTVAALTIVIGVAIRHGFSFFTGKIILLAIVMLIFNPLVAHILARSAYLSGERADENSESGEMK